MSLLLALLLLPIAAGAGDMDQGGSSSSFSISTGAATTAALTGNGNSSSPLGIDFSSVTSREKFDAWQATASVHLTNLAASTTLAKIGLPTYTTLQHFFDFALSPGVIAGGGISDLGTGNISVAAGTGTIKATDSNVAQLLWFNWPSSTTNIPSNSTRYIGVQYNVGAPTVAVKTSDSWDLETEFPLGVVVNEAGTLSIATYPWVSADNNANLIERLDSLAVIARDNRLGGLVISNTGTRNVAVTAGALLGRMSEFTISALDTSAASTFIAYYRDGSGGWTRQTGQTQWNNSQYDDGSGTLASLTALTYTSRWFYLMTNGSLAEVYGQSQDLDLSDILAEGAPASVPDRISKMGLLIGRFIIRASGTTPAVTQTAFGTAFTAANVTSHLNLSDIGTLTHAQVESSLNTKLSSAAIPAVLVDLSTVTTALSNKQDLDADLTDLADGTLTGSKVGSGVPAANIADGTMGIVNTGGNAATATGLAGGGAGQLPYQSASGTTLFMPSMASGGIITGNGSGVAPSTATLAGTANQITVTKTGTAVTLSGAGATTTCSAGQYPNSFVTSGGVVTSFTCSAAASLQAGSPVQVWFTSSTASATGTTDMVMDTTIPQITEGDQVLASTGTPLYSTSKLIVEAQAWLDEDTNTSSSGIQCCLFRDGTADSIGGCRINAVASNAEGGLLEHFNYKGETVVASNAASSTVFSLRCGLFGNGTGSSLRWNGQAGGSLLNGGLVTIIKVTEIYYP